MKKVAIVVGILTGLVATVAFLCIRDSSDSLGELVGGDLDYDD